MRFWFGSRDVSVEQRVKRLGFINKLLVINVFALIVGFFVYTLRVRFVIGNIIDNIDGVIALISGVSNRVQTLDNPLREVSRVLSELEKILPELNILVAV